MVHLDEERVRFWVKNGAQMSESVSALWKKLGGKLDEPAATPAETSDPAIA
jgi:ribosomal protein S16